MKQYIKVNTKDSVAVALQQLSKGQCIEVDGGLVLVTDIPQGHKFALQAITKGSQVVKYGNVIGIATQDIDKGAWVHTHNLKTSLSGKLDYEYNPIKSAHKTSMPTRTINMYKRANGQYGIRNELWIVPMVGCVNGIAQAIVAQAVSLGKAPKDGIHIFSHPYGCSQVGDDHETTRKILRAVVKHPNIGGILVLGLGCENNQTRDFMQSLGEYDKDRVKFLVAQEVNDEVACGVDILEQLAKKMQSDVREQTDISNLKIGLKCGGSDALSGITANPLLGLVCDYLTGVGGTAVLTEVPEMFGAEHILMERAVDKKVFDDTVNLINDFKEYFIKQNQPIYENPSPGNKAGGITTLEEKSLGCTQKGGHAQVEGVVEYGQQVANKGLNLLNSPGNDIVAVTALGAAGCHIVLFTTGRGTPLGGFVPVVKISTNDNLANRKPNWIDFNAGVILKDGFDGAFRDIMQLIVDIAQGKQTNNEKNQMRDIAIFKSGVTL